MARKGAPKQRNNEPTKSAEDSLSTSMSRFVSDMLRFTEINTESEMNTESERGLTVEQLLERNRIDNSDRETARTLRRCGKKISIN